MQIAPERLRKLMRSTRKQLQGRLKTAAETPSSRVASFLVGVSCPRFQYLYREKEGKIKILIETASGNRQLECSSLAMINFRHIPDAANHFNGFIF